MINKKGFTLIEILAVVVIIGTLMLLIIPVAIGVIDDAKQSTYNSQTKSIENAARSYIAEYGITISSLDNTNGTTTLTLRQLVEEGYLDLPIKNAKTNQDYDLDTTTILVTKLANKNYSYVVTAN